MYDLASLYEDMNENNWPFQLYRAVKPGTLAPPGRCWSRSSR
jgi:hypothetical protein